MRVYVLEQLAHGGRTSPTEFDLHRFRRLGLLGLLELETHRSGAYEIEVVPLGADDVDERWIRLCTLLGGLIARGQGDCDATCRAVRQGID